MSKVITLKNVILVSIPIPEKYRSSYLILPANSPAYPDLYFESLTITPAGKRIETPDRIEFYTKDQYPWLIIYKKPTRGPEIYKAEFQLLNYYIKKDGINPLVKYNPFKLPAKFTPQFRQLKLHTVSYSGFATKPECTQIPALHKLQKQLKLPFTELAPLYSYPYSGCLFQHHNGFVIISKLNSTYHHKYIAAFYPSVPHLLLNVPAIMTMTPSPAYLTFSQCTKFSNFAALLEIIEMNSSPENYFEKLRLDKLPPELYNVS